MSALPFPLSRGVLLTILAGAATLHTLSAAAAPAALPAGVGEPSVASGLVQDKAATPLPLLLFFHRADLGPAVPAGPGPLQGGAAGGAS